MMKNFYTNMFLCIVTLLCSVTVLQAQQRTVTGTVNDEFGPVAGANVMINGTNSGSATDPAGKYSITVSGSEDVLVFSFLGAKTQMIKIGDRSVLDVLLESDLTQIDELVVVGYGVQKKSHLTGSITKFETEAIADIPTTDVATALQGRLAGVSITNYSGEVGVSPQIAIRGGSALNDGGSPLVVVDNFVMEDGLSMVNAADIESIEILKDASSAAIYGSRAANGVIMVTTKQGSHMQPRYSLNYSIGFKSPYKLHELVSCGTFTEKLLEEYDQGGATVVVADLAALYLEENLGVTDWQSLGLQDNPITSNLQFSVSGGRTNLKYTVSGGHTKEEGLAANNTVEKYSFRSRVDVALSDYVDLGTNISMTYVDTERPTNNLLNYTRYPSWMPVYHNEFTSNLTGEPVGSYCQPSHFNTYYPIGDDGAMTSANPYNSTTNSPVSYLNRSSNNYDTYQAAGNLYLNVKILPNLIFRTANSMNLRYSSQDKFVESDASSDGDEAYGSFYATLRSNLTTDNTLSYDKTFGPHGLNVMAGASAEQSKTKVTELYGTGYPTNYISWLSAATSFNPDGTSVYLEPEENLMSFFGRVNYSLKDRYLLSAVLRADGYSLFGSNNKWGYFPSISAGWRVSEEPFMRDFKPISSLKIRAGYGMTGDNQISSTATVDLLYSALYSFGDGTGTTTPGLSNSSSLIANADLGWAKVGEFNLGFDIGFLDNRLNFVIDYYYSITKDMLFERPVSSVSGHEEYWSNEGKIRNSGVEIAVESFNIVSKDFKWTTSFNIAFDDNILLSLGGESQIINTASGTKESYISKVGSRAIQFYGYKTDGVWMSQDEIDSSPTFAAGNDVPGGLKVVDVNGDGQLNEDDMTVIGDPYADFTWGITNTFTYKNFDLSILIQGSQGGQMINGNGHYNDFKERDPEYGLYTRWVSEEYPGDGQTPTYLSGAINWMLTDYVVEDASYVSLRNITIGYTLPKSITDKLHIDGLRVFFIGENLFYITPSGYRGINSEYRNTSGDYSNTLISGYQRGAFPVTTSITAGINLKF